MENTQIQLFDQMITVFNEEDIRELCFRLNIAYGDLNGQNRRAKTISLVERCHQTNRTAELTALCQEARPLVVWPLPDALTVFVSTTETAQPEKPTLSSKQSSKIPMWVWGVVGLLLLVLVVFAIWQPWDGGEGEEETAVIPETPTVEPTTEPTAAPTETPEETAVSPPPSTTDGTIDIEQTVNGKITGAGTETWTFIGYEGQADIRVEGEPQDNFVLILYYPDGRQAEYIDYSGQGEGELLTYYEIQPDFKIEVDEVENDGAEYTLTVTDSATNYIWPSAAFSGAIRGANPEIYIFSEESAVVDIVVEMDETDLPFLSVYKQNGRELISTDQVDENGRLILENLVLDGYHEIVIRDMANDGAEFSIEMNESEGE